MKKLNISRFRKEERLKLKEYTNYGSKLFLKALKDQAKDYQNFDESIMQQAYFTFYERVFMDVAKRNYNLIRVTNQKDFVPDSFFLSTFRNWIGQWIENDVVMRGLIKNVNDRTRAEIGKAIGLGLEAGLTTSEIASSVVTFVGNPARALGIAMTEATRASAEGKKRSADQWARETGTELWKIWIHSNNPSEPRQSHIDIQNKPIKESELFPLVNLDKPGDPNGDPSETVRCGCTIVYVSRDYVARYHPSAL